jgi:hypothetical protein
MAKDELKADNAGASLVAGVLRNVNGPKLHVLRRREKIAELLRLFTSARKRSILTADEVLIFLAIGYLSTSTSNDLILVRPTSFSEVALQLGIPKETVRRKAMRLVDLDYVDCSSKGIFVRHLDLWCQMFDRAID